MGHQLFRLRAMALTLLLSGLLVTLPFVTPPSLHGSLGPVTAQPAQAFDVGGFLRSVLGPDGIGVTYHFVQQMEARGISVWNVIDAFFNGVWNWNESADQIEIYGNNVELILKDGLLITVWLL